VKKRNYNIVKKMLLISNMYPSDSNPTYGTFIKNFEEQMQNEGFTIRRCVISGRGKGILEKLKKYITFFKQTVNAVRQEDYDLIYVHYINHSLLPLLFIKNSISKPLILNAHGSDVLPYTNTGKFVQRLITPIIKSADLIVVPTNYFKSIVKNTFSFDGEKIFVSPSGGVDTKLFTKKPYIYDRKLTIGYVSRIDKSKGWDIFLNALKLIKEKTDHDFNVIIIGDGPDIKELKKCIKTYGLAQDVLLLGAIEHSKLPQYYQKMDLFIFPTLGESLGLVGLEAMACSVPVLGSNIPALQEYIFPNKNGNLFNKGDAMDLFTKINHFIYLDPEKKKTLSSIARKNAEKYDSIKTSYELNKRLTQVLLEIGSNA
jgi:glycosyltransferase involved in cell wall biosynthesis